MRGIERLASYLKRDHMVAKVKKHVILTKILLKITWIHKNLKINRTQFHFDY